MALIIPAHLRDASWIIDPSKSVIHPELTSMTVQCTLGWLMGISKDDTLESWTLSELDLARYLVSFLEMFSLAAAPCIAFRAKNVFASAGDAAT